MCTSASMQEDQTAPGQARCCCQIITPSCAMFHVSMAVLQPVYAAICAVRRGIKITNLRACRCRSHISGASFWLLSSSRSFCPSYSVSALGHNMDQRHPRRHSCARVCLGSFIRAGAWRTISMISKHTCSAFELDLRCCRRLTRRKRSATSTTPRVFDCACRAVRSACWRARMVSTVITLLRVAV